MAGLCLKGVLVGEGGVWAGGQDWGVNTIDSVTAATREQNTRTKVLAMINYVLPMLTVLPS